MDCKTCPEHSGLEANLQHLAGEVGEIKDTTGKIWTKLDAATLADAKRQATLGAWRAVALVLGLVSTGLGIGIKAGWW